MHVRLLVTGAGIQLRAVYLEMDKEVQEVQTVAVLHLWSRYIQCYQMNQEPQEYPVIGRTLVYLERSVLEIAW